MLLHIFCETIKIVIVVDNYNMIKQKNTVFVYNFYIFYFISLKYIFIYIHIIVLASVHLLIRPTIN